MGILCPRWSHVNQANFGTGRRKLKQVNHFQLAYGQNIRNLTSEPRGGEGDAPPIAAAYYHTTPPLKLPSLLSVQPRSRFLTESTLMATHTGNFDGPWMTDWLVTPASGQKERQKLFRDLARG